MAYDGRAIANFVLDFCDARSRQITHIHLQKLVYFCHVWSLIELHRPLVKHKFEAWDYGPVLPYLYREFKVFEQHPINRRATRIEPLDGSSRIVEYDFDQPTSALLDRVTDFYSQLKAGDLIELSHAKGGPWDRAWNHRGAVTHGKSFSRPCVTRIPEARCFVCCIRSRRLRPDHLSGNAVPTRDAIQAAIARYVRDNNLVSRHCSPFAAQL
jgi:uncharacterized phage-associated protein